MLVLLWASHVTAFNRGGLAWLEGPTQAFCWFGGCCWPTAGPWFFSLCGHSSSIRLDWFPGGDSRKQEGISGPCKALAQTSYGISFPYSIRQTENHAHPDSKGGGKWQCFPSDTDWMTDVSNIPRSKGMVDPRVK